MRRVVVTGIGIVSSIGGNADEVLSSLRDARPGVEAAPEYAQLGFRCQVHAPAKVDNWEELVDRRAARFLAPGTGYAHIAMDQALADAGLTPRRDLRRADRADRRLGRPLHQHHRRRRPDHPRQRPQARRPLRRAQGDELRPLGRALDLVQDPRRELFDLLGLRDLHPLHRRGL